MLKRLHGAHAPTARTYHGATDSGQHGAHLGHSLATTMLGAIQTGHANDTDGTTDLDPGRFGTLV